MIDDLSKHRHLPCGIDAQSACLIMQTRSLERALVGLAVGVVLSFNNVFTVLTGVEEVLPGASVVSEGSVEATERSVTLDVVVAAEPAT